MQIGGKVKANIYLYNATKEQINLLQNMDLTFENFLCN